MIENNNKHINYENYSAKMLDAMDLRGFAVSTKKIYLAHVKRYFEFTGKPPENCSYEDVRAFLLHGINVKKFSAQYINAAYSALKFFYRFVLGWDWEMAHIPRCKRRHFIPVTLMPGEIEIILNSISNIKHRAIVSTIYSAGLRVSEAARLKISDIDSVNMRIFISQSKGYKDRYTLLSQRNLLLLREYFKQYKPKTYLFEGQDGNSHISIRTIQITFLEAVRRCGINKKATVHSLRHSFATNMLNNGVNILNIKELLGHGSIQTTERYLHLTSTQVLGVKSPFDTFHSFDSTTNDNTSNTNTPGGNYNA